MGKKIYWTIVGLLAVAGVVIMVQYGLAPRPIPKIKLSQFETHTVLANSLLLRLREEIKANPVIFLGVQPEMPEQLNAWKAFLSQNQEVGLKYDVVVVEQDIPNVDSINPDVKMRTKEQFSELFDGIQKHLGAGQRVAVLVPSIYSARAIYGNLVNNYTVKSGKPPLGFTMVDFPRNRESEKSMVIPCSVEGVDQSGTGPFGCMVAKTARFNYRKHFEAGKYVGLVDQVGLDDYLVFYTLEK